MPVILAVNAVVMDVAAFDPAINTPPDAPAAALVPFAIVPTAGGVEACAPAIESRHIEACPVGDACVTVNVPVSDPVDHL